MQLSPEKSSPALNASELVQIKWFLGGVIALFGVLAVPLFDLSGLELVPFAFVGICIATLRPALSLKAPSLIQRFLPLGLIVYVAADVFLSGDILAALIRFALLLLIARAVLPRERREDLQLVVLSLFLIVVGGVLTSAFIFSGVLVLFSGLALIFLFLVTLASAHRAQDNSTGWSNVRWLLLFKRVRENLRWDVVGLAGGLFALMVFLAALLFLVLPRIDIENSLGQLSLKNKRSLTGFSDTVSIGDVTDIQEDTGVALRVEANTPERLPSVPYWRMVALDAYEAGVFRVSPSLLRGELFTTGAQGEITGSRTVAQGADALVWTFYFEAGVSRYLPLPGMFSQMRLREPSRVARNIFSEAVALREMSNAMFAYRMYGVDVGGEILDAEVLRRLRRAAEDLKTTPAYPQTLLSGPKRADDHAKLRAIVSEISKDERLSARDFSARAVKYLEERHRYALRSALRPGEGDPFVRWLSAESAGHCEFFAGSFVLLARAAGFPTRLITGFKGGAWNDFESYFMVRNSDAHAWCEILDERGVWLRVDPTPGASAVAAAAGRAVETPQMKDRTFGAYVDSLRVLWYRRVVNFDQQTQAKIASRARVLAKDLQELGRERLQKLQRLFFSFIEQPWSWETILRAVGGALLLLGAVFAGWRYRYVLRRQWNFLRGRERRRDPLRAEASYWIQRLARRGRLELDADLRRDLLRVRFGVPLSDREARMVFRRSRRLLRA